MYSPDSIQFHLLVIADIDETVFRYAWNSFLSDRITDLISISSIGKISEEDRKNLVDIIYARKKSILDFINPFKKQMDEQERSEEEQKKLDDEMRENTIKRLGTSPFNSLGDILKSMNAVADDVGSNI